MIVFCWSCPCPERDSTPALERLVLVLHVALTAVAILHLLHTCSLCVSVCGAIICGRTNVHCGRSKSVLSGHYNFDIVNACTAVRPVTCRCQLQPILTVCEFGFTMYVL